MVARNSRTSRLLPVPAGARIADELAARTAECTLESGFQHTELASPAHERRVEATSVGLGSGDGEQPVCDERLLASAQSQVVEDLCGDGITNELEGQRAEAEPHQAVRRRAPAEPRC